MSNLFAFICTRTSADFVVPVSAPSQGDFNRKVHNAFRGMVGGHLNVGDIKFRPTQDAVQDHLLCDGSVVQREQFPLLVDYLAGAGAAQATLPAPPFTFGTVTVTQTTSDSGTVSTGTPATPAGTVGGTTGGNVVSGGRTRGELGRQ